PLTLHRVALARLGVHVLRLTGEGRARARMATAVFERRRARARLPRVPGWDGGRFAPLSAAARSTGTRVARLDLRAGPKRPLDRSARPLAESRPRIPAKLAPGARDRAGDRLVHLAEHVELQVVEPAELQQRVAGLGDIGDHTGQV